MKSAFSSVLPQGEALQAGVEVGAPVKLSPAVYANLCRCLGGRPPEAGGLLGSSDGGKTIDAFAFDYGATTGSAVYVPDLKNCNRILSRWDDEGILMRGIVHTHPDGATVPSVADLQACAAYIKAVPGLGGHMELPILQVGNSYGGFRIYWYTAYPDGKGGARVVRRPVTVNGRRVDAARAPSRARTRIVPEEDLFVRKESVFPTSVSRRKKLVVFGCGGSRAFLTEAARLALGDYWLLDGDRIDPPNLATQGVYADEIGLPKVQALAAQLRRVDPYCHIYTSQQMLDRSFTDRDFERLAGPTLFRRPTDVVICAFTDSFEANARAAALAVKYGTAFLQGLVYQHGSVAEIVFSYPGVTPACPRCCLASRYDAYLQGTVKQVEDVSAGCPISATAMLNAYKLEVLEELLFYGEKGPYRDKLATHARTNLLMVRLADQLPAVLEGSTFDKATRDAAGQPLIGGAFWDTITPDHPSTNGAPACPLCGGTGNLLDALGRPADTRRIA